jgi:hypothetical protein
VCDDSSYSLGDDVIILVMVECILTILILIANEIHYFSNYFDTELYIFRTDLLSIIRSLNTVCTAIGICQHNCMTNTCCCVYSVETPDDGQYICPKHVEFCIKINLRNSASRWLLL